MLKSLRTPDLDLNIVDNDNNVTDRLFWEQVLRSTGLSSTIQN
jgi:hypothetical protein